MRTRFVLGTVLCFGLPAGPALAQVQPGNPNAANNSFALQSQFRSMNQQRTSDFNTLSMQVQRNVQFSPPAVVDPGLYAPLGWRGHRAVGRRHGLNTSICTGC